MGAHGLVPGLASRIPRLVRALHTKIWGVGSKRTDCTGAPVFRARSEVKRRKKWYGATSVEKLLKGSSESKPEALHGQPNGKGEGVEFGVL